MVSVSWWTFPVDLTYLMDDQLHADCWRWVKSAQQKMAFVDENWKMQLNHGSRSSVQLDISLFTDG